MAKIELTIQELESMLYEQKKATADYITRNLSTYSFYPNSKIDIDVTKQELKNECLKSNFPSEFNTLKKYIKQ